MVFVLFGSSRDYCCLQIAKLLEEYNLNIMFINELSFARFTFNWNFSDDIGYLVLAEQSAEFKDIEGVILRWNRNKAATNEDDFYKNYEWNGTLLAWSHSMSCPVINRLTPDYWYGEGITAYDIQHQLCRSGFKPLSSLVTRDLSKAQNFLKEHSQEVFIQPLSCPETIYSLKNKNSESLLTKILTTLPVRLVEYPEGERLEAFVFQNKVFLADKKGTSATSDHSLVQILEHLSHTVDISFLQVHVIKCTSGSYSCIGLNDMPNYEWCSADLKEKISHQLISVLGIS
jgi:hypothetical protein